MGSLSVSAALLDTHVLVWLLSGNARLGVQARGHIQHAAKDNVLLVSAITPWEIAMLVSKGRLALDRDVGEWVAAAWALPGIRLAPLSPEVAVASTRLPGILHADPADHILAATARHVDAVLVTEDQRLLDYGEAGHLRVLRAAV
ncbi:MAG: type II toxin-antitoxin system VapC family toxin [Candidatus Competibacter sp.]|nr:type II toxin-antitoxin system VapC family toxin [Candidatus Competibacter sp.]